MAITLITGPANAGKAPLVIDAVRRELAHGAEPLLIVPTRADAQQYLRELAGEASAMGVRVSGFDGLIEEALSRAQLGARALGELGRERLVASLAARSPLARAGGARVSAGLVQAIVALISELQVRRVSTARWRGALARWSAEDGDEVSREELADLFEAYTGALEHMHRLDGEQLAVAALDRLRRSPALWGSTPVAVYGFDDLTPLQLDVIETLGRVVGASVTVSLTYEPGRAAFAGRAATFAALRPLADEHVELAANAEYYAPHARSALAHLERSLFELDAPRVDPAGAVRLLEGGGERAELELIAREIGVLLGEGTAAEEIAVAMRSSARSAELLKEVFQAAGIPLSLERPIELGDTAIGRALIGLLRCLGPAGDTGDSVDADETTGGRPADLLAWLRAPGLLARPELADALEIRARRAGARSVAEARALWEQRHWPLETIDQLEDAAARGPAALIERTARELQWLFAAPRRGTAAVLDEQELEEARALAAGRSALAELRELAWLAPELAPASGAELASTLERVSVFSGSPPAPGLVAVLDPLALRARRVSALFVCALQEGVFPARARPQALLADEERRRLAETSGLRLGEQEDQLASERYLLYAAISRPQELLVLSWHVADDDGNPTARSLFVDDICDLFSATLAEQRVRRPLGAAEARASPAALATGPGQENAPAATGLPATGERDLQREREGRPPAGEGGLTDERVLSALRTRPWSASSLEGWIRCPMRWYVMNVLRPGAFEPDPEPLARGGLAHAALNDTLEGLRERTGSARVTHPRLGLARELLVAALERREGEYPLSVAPERRPGVRRRLRADLERYLARAADVESPLEPEFLELGFGIEAGDERGEASVLPAYDFGGGAMLRGRIDRVDVNERREAVVYDYKSSFAPAPAKWVGEGKLQVALYMRAVEELLGVRAVGGFYQPLSGSDLRARGVLDDEAPFDLDCVRGDARSSEELAELLDDAIDAAREAVAQVGRGELRARPRSCAFGRDGGCEFPTICRCEP